MGNRLKEIRLNRGLTQDQLGDRVGCSGQQIQYLESGKRNLTERWMKRLAGPLGIKPHELMYESEPDSAENDQEKELLKTFRQMKDHDQSVYLSMATAFLKGEDKEKTKKQKAK